MGYTIAQKIIKNHLVCGEMTVGSDIGLKIDQTLTQDATGTMAYIEYEAMGIPRVKTEKSDNKCVKGVFVRTAVGALQKRSGCRRCCD